MQRLRMDDHKEAYLFWKEMGFFRASCLHVDAHLDILNFKTPSTEGEYPELNCANFLLFAIREEIVSEVVWIIPPYLLGSSSMLDWFRDEIRRWMCIDQDDYFTFQLLGPTTVVGQLAGARLMVTTADELRQHWQPPTDRPLLLDIDIDYFLGQELGCASERSVVWQHPWELLELLGPLNWAAETVADSVSGGYTPVELRCLGFLTELCLDGQLDYSKACWEAITEPESLLSDELTQVGWVQAARLGQSLLNLSVPRDDQRWFGLVQHHPDFEFTVLDQAAMYFQRKLDPQAISWGERDVDCSSETTYMLAFIAARQGNVREAIRRLDELVSSDKDGLEPPDKRTSSHLLILCAKFCLQVSDYPLAQQYYLRAIKLDSHDDESWRGIAESWVGLGNLTEATKCLRKAIALRPKLLTTGETRLRLIELYRLSGQTLLLQAEFDRLAVAHPHLQDRLK